MTNTSGILILHPTFDANDSRQITLVQALDNNWVLYFNYTGDHDIILELEDLFLAVLLN